MKIYQVDAFTSQIFSGNPAGVMIVDEFLNSELMQNIAMEMNLSETTFIKQIAGNNYEIKFFTPAEEIDLCGHATLSCAHVLFSKNIVSIKEKITFHTKGGELVVQHTKDGYEMEFPQWGYKSLDDVKNAEKITGVESIIEVYANNEGWRILIVNNKDNLKNIHPNFSKMKGTDYGNIVVTCKGDENYDYYMRCFVTDCDITEDPVTGSIECVLAPLWSKVLEKTEIQSFQSSQRGGEKKIKVLKDSITISGNAITIGEMELFI